MRAKITYSNEVGLRKRFKSLVDSLGAVESKKILGKKPKDILSNVVDTRNYFTHYDETTARNVYEGRELFVVTQKLKAFFLLTIFRDLGLSVADATRLILDSNHFRFYCEKDI